MAMHVNFSLGVFLMRKLRSVILHHHASKPNPESMRLEHAPYSPITEASMQPIPFASHNTEQRPNGAAHEREGSALDASNTKLEPLILFHAVESCVPPQQARLVHKGAA
jgi:hypothetical protein